ncbi:MAG: hypothetical protein ABH839_01950, partial [Chloroflexota bacterium]
TIAREGTNTIQVRSRDKAGNMEEAVSEAVKIDRTPPTLTESTLITTIDRVKKQSLIVIDYNGTVEDSISGVCGSTSTVLIDEYGEMNQDLGSDLSGAVSIEAWCDGKDKDGRIYIIRLTASDLAGNTTTTETTVTVSHDNGS